MRNSEPIPELKKEIEKDIEEVRKKEKEIKKFSFNIVRGVEAGEIVALIMPNKTYNSDIIDITKQLAKKYNTICYLSLNRLHDHLIKSFAINNIDIDKFFFIDAVTRSVTHQVKESPNSVFISSISALTELIIATKKALEKGKFDCLIFDSLSTMLIYNDEADVIKFVHNLIGKIREVNATAILTSLEGDSKSNLMKDLGMFVDKLMFYF